MQPTKHTIHPMTDYNNVASEINRANLCASLGRDADKPVISYRVNGQSVVAKSIDARKLFSVLHKYLWHTAGLSTCDMADYRIYRWDVEAVRWRWEIFINFFEKSRTVVDGDSFLVLHNKLRPAEFEDFWKNLVR